MKLSSASISETVGSQTASTSDTHLHGHWLASARVVWMALVACNLGLFVIGLPRYDQQLQTACVNSVTCTVYGALTAKGLQRLPAFGLSVSEYAAFNTTLFIVIASIWSLIGLIIFWRKSNDWLALLVAFMLISFNTSFTGGPSYVLALNYPVLDGPVTLLDFLSTLSLYFFFFLFPNGRFVPRWIGWVIVLFLAQELSALFLPLDSPLNATNWPGWLSFLGFLTICCAIIFSQLYRYLRVSNPIQRQQTKCVVFGIIIVMLGFVGFSIFLAIFPMFNQPDTLYLLIPNTGYPLLLLLLPFSIGIAVLRSRLWDIDVIINRTVVYGLLTAVLALVYFGLIFALQYLLRNMINQKNDVAIVVSTLAIAALFQPLRLRLQKLIDRGFYRHKYNAARTVAAFSTTLRNEVDLLQLTEQLVQVVEETMHPVSVSLWIRKTNQEKKPPTNVE